MARVVDARGVERLVALETADVDVPPPAGSDGLPPFYFRVLPQAPGSLRIELWELGKPEGARSVSAAGSASLEARRLALAAAELARRFRERRLAELAALEGRAAHDDPATETREGIPIFARLGWSAGVEAAHVSSGFFVGPRMDASLRFQTGPRLDLGAAWLVGSVEVRGEGRAARFLELPLSVSDALPLSAATALDVGLTASVASVRLSGNVQEPAIDTWSARGGVFVRVEASLGRTLSLSLGPDASMILHRVPGAFGGAFLGGVVALTLAP